ncbi:MAG: hypothetical protein F6K39_18565 [Okeania sp. SIO3B3]|nr:hypothetical protein [Okeania sp. SIO3B3]
MLKNHKLASAIADCGFYEFKRQLTYKCEWYGSELYHVRLNTYTLEEGRHLCCLRSIPQERQLC